METANKLWQSFCGARYGLCVSAQRWFDEFINKPLRVAHIYACLVAHLGVLLDYVKEVGYVKEAVIPSDGDVADWSSVVLPSDLYVGLMTAAEEHSITQLQVHMDTLEKFGPKEQALARHLRMLDEQYDMQGIKSVLLKMGRKQ